MPPGMDDVKYGGWQNWWESGNPGDEYGMGALGKGKSIGKGFGGIWGQGRSMGAREEWGAREDTENPGTGADSKDLAREEKGGLGKGGKGGMGK